ncbi:hypothetical protein E5329_24255 [Petralouisia muris]|uniref:Uncharacterized protein n=1 Tax=Petralouisia muris TaxID=3032872 RepID=A0AC61RP97_9FIRM|nr:hypothetical protein [Petralouisia muris]TGY90813.1 hypothetical protein E5329_24255 [Petralouisia muris]
MENPGNKTKYLLDMFVKIRTVKALNKAVSRNSTYHDTMKRQDKAFDKLDNAELSKEQSAIVDKSLSVPMISAQHMVQPLQIGIAGRNKACA